MARGIFRKPSWKKMLGAWKSQLKRSIKRIFFPWYGKKGTGWLTNPRKAAYNWWYNRTSISFYNFFGMKKHKGGWVGGLFCGLIGWVLLPVCCLTATTHIGVSKARKAYRARRENGAGRNYNRASSDRSYGTGSGSGGGYCGGGSSSDSSLGSSYGLGEASLGGSSRSEGLGFGGVRLESGLGENGSSYGYETKDYEEITEPIVEEEEKILTTKEPEAIVKKFVEIDDRPCTLSVVKKGENNVEAFVKDGEESLETLWIENLERFFSDNNQLLEKGKTGVGEVKKLFVEKGRITAEFTGEKIVPFKVIITIEPMTEKQIQEFYKNGERATDLFPSKKDFWLFCTCNIDQDFCEHAFAVLYAFGKELKEEKKSLYSLRGVENKQ